VRGCEEINLDLARWQESPSPAREIMRSSPSRNFPKRVWFEGTMPKMILLPCLWSVAALAYEPAQPIGEIEVLRLEWKDEKRKRQVPAKIYLRKENTAPSAVVIFSHGLGGSREGYEYLGRHWAGCGYVSVHLQHLGSDDAVWKEVGRADRKKALDRAAFDFANAENRPRDVSFAIDALTAANADTRSTLYQRLELGKIGVAGHSFGGFTALAVAGQTLGLSGSISLADPRVKAVVQMSAPLPQRASDRQQVFGRIKIPVFHLTGTQDDSLIGNTTAEQRRIPFDSMKNAETSLLIFEDGDHMIFSDAPRRDSAQQEQDAIFHRHICAATTAWWDAYLREDSAAKHWLLAGAFTERLGKSGRFETKKTTD
jgi:predicted dienelactone hydrolase